MSDARRDYFGPAAHAAILLLGFVAYYGIWDNSFYKDDYLWMSAARDEMRGAGVFLHQTVGFFRPLTNLVFYGSERVAPGNGAFYNSTNLLVHLLNAVLVYHLLGTLFRARFVALAGALIFVSAHNHSGAVIWVSARTTLIMTAFVLGALLAATRIRRRGVRLAASAGLYALALATKETAVAGAGLAVLLFLRRREDGARVVGAQTLGTFLVVTALYATVRAAVVGSFAQSNWGFGGHVITNLLGAVVYSYYPWDLARLAGPSAVLRPSSSPIWPEAAGLLVLAVLLSVAPAGERRRNMATAVGWILVALLPAAGFHFRFLGEISHVHNRYYYLAGVGVSASIALFLGWLWEMPGPRAWTRGGAAALLGLVVAFNVGTLRRVEAYWGDSNRRFEAVVDDVLIRVAENPRMPAVVVTGLDGWQPYLARALDYRLPDRRVLYERGGREAAAADRPCLLVDLERRPDGQVVFRLYELP